MQILPLFKSNGAHSMKSESGELHVFQWNNCVCI